MLVNKEHRFFGDTLVEGRAGVLVDGHTVYHADGKKHGLVRVSGDRVYRVQPGYVVPRSLESTWASWRAMISRTGTPGCDGYARYRHVEVYSAWRPEVYGGRGQMASQWAAFASFAAWAIRTIGLRPVGRTLDRCSGRRRYWPGELRWATPGEQQRHRRGERS